MAFEVEFYRLDDGEKPVATFIKSLPVKLQNKTMDALRILEDEGTNLRTLFKAMGNGLFELRIKFASDIARVFTSLWSGTGLS